MVEKFHIELEKLKQNVLKMGDLATSMLCKAVESLKNLDLRESRMGQFKEKRISKNECRSRRRSVTINCLVSTNG